MTEEGRTILEVKYFEDAETTSVIYECEGDHDRMKLAAVVLSLLDRDDSFAGILLTVLDKVLNNPDELEDFRKHTVNAPDFNELLKNNNNG